MLLTPEHEGVEIFYRSEGAGPPLLLISGTGHDHQFWSGQLPFFTEEFRTLVFDNRGVGRSSVPDPGYTLADMASDAIRVLDAADVEMAHVMGFSMGGHIAQELAINYPDRVSSLGVHHSWCRNSPRLRSFQETRLELARQDQRLALAEFSMLGLHSHDYYNEHAEEMVAHRNFLLEQSPMNVGWVGQLEACLAGDTWARLDRIVAPTLVTCSTLDVIAAPHHSREIADRIQGATFVELAHSGHVALMERPIEFAELCLDFLRPLTGEFEVD